MSVLFAEEDMLVAYDVLIEAYGRSVASHRLTRFSRNPPRPLHAIPREKRALFARARRRARAEERRRLLDWFLERFSGNPWLSALAEGPYPRLVRVAFVALPPQVTIPRLWPKQYVLKPGSYINTAFIPVTLKEKHGRERHHRSFIPRVTYTEWYLWFTLEGNWAKAPYAETLRKVYETLLDRHRSREENEKRAVRLAKRDTFRVLVGSAWLLWVCMACRDGIMEPRDAPLPYSLAKEPELHAPYMIEPYQVIPAAPTWCTWRWLLESR